MNHGGGLPAAEALRYQLLGGVLLAPRQRSTALTERRGTPVVRRVNRFPLLVLPVMKGAAYA